MLTGVEYGRPEESVAGFRVIERKVQPAALLARERGADDQLGHHDQVAQLQQVGRYLVIAVVLIDFGFQ